MPPDARAFTLYLGKVFFCDSPENKTVLVRATVLWLSGLSLDTLP